MEIKIDLKIFLFAIVFSLTGQIDLYIICMIFALVHEAGHIIAGMFMEYKIKIIKIMPLGFSIIFKVNLDDYNKKIINGNIYNLKKLIIALAGPIMSIFVFFIVMFFNINTYIKIQIVYINLLIAIFNLIPIYPLDGGRILKNILRIIYGNKSSARYTNIISNVVIILLTAVCSVYILYIKNIAIFFILIYLWIIVIIENKKYKNMLKIYEINSKL